MNLQHDETIEFRCFRSTLKYETFILTLEFIQSIVDFAKAINIEGIESITWQDLMVKMPKSVQDYYTNRKVQKKDLILKELKKQLKNLKSALSHALNNIEKNRLRKEIEKVNKQIKQRKADNKKECSNSDEESVAHP